MIAPNIGNNEHERYVFIADEVVFQVLHPPITDQESGGAIITQMIGAINSFLRPGGIDLQLGENNWRNRLEPPNADSRIVTFSSPTQLEGSESFSLIPIKIIGHAQDDLTPNDVVTLLNDAYTDLGGSFIVPGGGGDDEDDDEKEKDDDGKRKDNNEEDDDNENTGNKGNGFQSIDLGNEIGLKSISPNWLASDLHHGGATGGPGSLPVSKPAPSEAARQFHLEGPIDSLTDYRRPGAQVAILDTGPYYPLDQFPSEIREILLANPILEVITYPSDLIPSDLYTLYPHHYQMPDHGTFIASIIRAITPSAKIYLYAVLNSYGVGSFISTAQGAVDAVNQRGSNIPPVILNCSFMLDDDLKDLDIEIGNLNNRGIQDLLRVSMRDVFNWATTTSNLDVIVVASAGNDSTHGNRRKARYPAAFNEVVSVAALPKNYPKSNGRYKPSSYSNRAHSGEPNKNEAYSIATLGGELVDGTLSPKEGVLGVYIGEIPTRNADGTFLQGPPANTTAWAEWSGTSFAAPIITALLALPTVPQVMGAMSSDPYLTAANEHVILERQG